MGNMFKKNLVLCVGIIIVSMLLIQSSQKSIVKCKFTESIDDELMIQVISGENSESIYITDTGGNGNYFFLPSYVDSNILDLSEFEGAFFDVDGEWSEVGTYVWQENRACTVVSTDGEVYEIKFAKSGNIPTLFIDTQSGSMDYLLQNKEFEECGNISIVNEKGQYEKKDEELTRVSGRGNTTFTTRQPGLGFTMKTGSTICGLDYGKKWVLLSLYCSPDLMKTKIVYDMAKEIGMEFQPESTWVDLYCNGIYMGVYLLSEAVEVSATRVNIYDLEEENNKANYDMLLENSNYYFSRKMAYYDIVSPKNINGGYIIEKTPAGRLQKGESFFCLNNSDFTFSIKSPGEASLDEVKYIQEFVQMINDKVVNEDENYWDYIDMDSFAQQFLIDIIACEQDAMWDSTFYYKDVSKDVLFAGPLWDYDRSFGMSQNSSGYLRSIEECVGSMGSWYLVFYRDIRFQELLKNYYIKLFPYIEELVNNRIDEYVEILSVAQKTTELLLDENQGNYHEFSYQEYDNSIRYLKYNIVNRCNFLSCNWGLGDDYILKLPTDCDEKHVVQFYNEERILISEIAIKDGECIKNLPSYDKEIYQGWRMEAPWLIYNGLIPIYEDTKMILESK